MSPRYPFTSFPRGWFVVGVPSDVAIGEVKTVHYFGKDIVLFRTESGVLTAVDRTCPHLGAHLGDGRVEGERLRCPFHAWGFDTKGKCVDIPYAPKIPPKAAVRTWPLVEQNGVILVWYCPDGAPPTWVSPPLEDAGWTPNHVIRWEIRSHPQEVAENTVDAAHLHPVHHVQSCKVVSVEQPDHTMRVVLNMVATGAVIQMPDEVNDVELDVWLFGLGQVISNTHVLTAGLKTRQRIYPTPIDGDRIAIFGIANTVEMPDPEYTKEMDEIFWNAFIADFPKDFPIWDKKEYLDRPLLVGGDGPIGKYRRWARQFYDLPEDTVAPQPTAAPSPASPIDRLTDWLRRIRAAAPFGNGTNGTGHAPRAPRPSPSDADDIAPAAAAPVEAAPSASQTTQFTSVDAYFAELESRFDPHAAGDLDAVYQWVLHGGSPKAHFAEIRGGRIQASEGTHPAPTVTIEMSTEDYLLMINGELNGARAFSTGRGKLRGPVRLAMKMKKLFPLERAV